MAVLNNTGILMGASAVEASSGDALAEIKRSIKLDDQNSAELKTHPSRCDPVKMTFSYWVKGIRVSNQDTADAFQAEHQSDSAGNRTTVGSVYQGYVAFQPGNGAGGPHMSTIGQAVRDPSSWTHVVVSVDMSLDYGNSKSQIWINGIPADYRTAGGWDAMSGNSLSGFNGNGSPWKINQEGTQLLADFYYISGMRLGAAAFGKFDENMIWQPKAFSIPQVNNGTVWSTSGVTATNWGGHGSGDYNEHRLFDGKVERQAGNYAANGNKATIEWSTPIKYNSSLRLYCHLDGRASAGNLGVHVTTDKGVVSHWSYEDPGSGNEIVKWITFAVGAGEFSKIVIDKNATNTDYGNSVRAIEVDGQVLQDGKIDPTTYNNVNTGHKWSDYVTGNAYSGTYSIDKAFDGRKDTMSSSALDSAHQFKPYKTITANSQIRLDLYIGNGSTANMLKCNGTDLTADARANATDGSFYQPRKWYCLDSKTIDTTNGLEWKSISGEDAQIFGIEVDGCMLIDQGQDNSFHLNFEDNALQRALAANSMGTQLVDSDGNQLTGDAFPIRKTNNGGNKTISGYRDDVTSGGVDVSDYCVFAWDVSGDEVGTGGVDVSNHINSSSTQKTVSKQGADSGTELTSTMPKWYERSATKGNADSTYFQIDDHADLDGFTGDFCIEFWVNLAQDVSEQVIVCKGGKNIQSTNEANAWGFFIDNDTLQFGCSSSGSSNDICGQNELDCSEAGKLDDFRGEWVHYAVSRQGATFRAFQNGHIIDTHTDPAGGGGATTVNNSGDSVIIGANRSGAESAQYMKIQDLRIYKGHAKYTAAFDIPQKCQWGTANITHADGSASGWINVDSSLRSPTMIVPENGDTGVGGEISGKYCQYNQFHCTYMDDSNDFDEAGQIRHSPGGKWHQTLGTIGVTSGKWYWESFIGAGQYDTFGIMDMGVKMNDGDWVGARTGQWALYPYNGKKYKGPSQSSADYITATSTNTNHTVMCALDMDNKKVWWGIDGTWGDGTTNGSGTEGNPASGTGEAYAFSAELVSGRVTPCFWTYSTTGKTYHNYGEKAFKYTAPSGFKCLVDANLPDPVIKDGSQHFASKLYMGDGESSHTIKGLNFKPGLIWIKRLQDSGYSWQCHDAVQGVNYGVNPDSTGAQFNDSSTIKAFNSDGFEVGNHASSNASDKKYISYAWYAGDSAATPSSSYDITPSAQWVNQDAGFSITKWTGTGTHSDRVPHGLGTNPAFIISKRLDSATGGNWQVKHKNQSTGAGLLLDDNSAEDASPTNGNLADLTSNVTFGFNNGSSTCDNVNASGATYITYCWAEVAGYSSFGAYEGLHSTDKSVFIYTDMQPEMVIMKKIGATQAGADQWFVIDRSNNPVNGGDFKTNFLDSDGGQDQHSNYSIDMFSNGFRQASSNGPNHNGGGGQYVYAAWGKHPFKLNRGG